MKMTNHIKIICLKNLKIEENLGKFMKRKRTIRAEAEQKS